MSWLAHMWLQPFWYNRTHIMERMNEAERDPLKHVPSAEGLNPLFDQISNEGEQLVTIMIIRIIKNKNKPAQPCILT